MAIREKSAREAAAAQFRGAGLGAKSADHAAKILFETGVSFESAAVMGQRIDEESTATPATIREAANRWDQVRNGPRTTTAWGRSLEEVEKVTQRHAPQASDAAQWRQSHSATTEASDASTRVNEVSTISRDHGIVHIDGVPYRKIVEYATGGDTEHTPEQITEQKVTHTPWGRKLEG